MHLSQGLNFFFHHSYLHQLFEGSVGGNVTFIFGVKAVCSDGVGFFWKQDGLCRYIFQGLAMLSFVVQSHG